MATRKVSYKNLLKEAISEFDTSKTVEVKGPMLDPILSWDGDGELPIYKDAASILERYYFDDETSDHISVDDLNESEYNEDGTEGKTSAEKHGEGTGTEQAGTSDASGMRAMEKDKEEDIAKEMLDLFSEQEDESDDDDDDQEGMEESILQFFSEQEDEDESDDDDEDDDKELNVDKDMNESWDLEESDDVTEDIENAVIEKLIDEMEESDIMTYTDDGVKSGMEAPKEKKAKRPDEDTEGAGTEQAGTGTAAGQVPDRKDMADQMVKPKNYNEDASAVPGGPSPNKTGEDWDEDEDDIKEAFSLFREAIQEEDEDF